MWQSYSIHIICTDIDITFTYSALLFISLHNKMSTVTCLGFKGPSEVVNKQGACKGEGGIEKSKFSCVRPK